MKQFLATLSLVFSLSSLVFFTACGDDSSTSVNDDDSSSSNTVVQSSSSVSLSGASAKSNGSSDGKKVSSSSSKKVVASSSSRKTDGGSEPAMTSSSSKKVALSSSGKASSSSSSSVIPDSVPGSASSSSSVILSSSEGSSNSKAPSSSSEYVPFDHSKTLAEDWRVGENRYKQFTDPRNGRSYYYITITSVYSGDSVTVMAENLNIGEMVLGKDDQKDDTKIERYCYNNDTTKCDEFGGLYQWAEMMQLPSRCNTESCSDLIQKNHQGICPDGWRLFTYDDYEIVRGYKDEYDDGIKGLCSSWGFSGTNASGFSLTGGGLRRAAGVFDDVKTAIHWAYPQEHDYDMATVVHSAYVTASAGGETDKDKGSRKAFGYSVRCVMVEK